MRLRKLLRKIHRYIGVFTAIWLLLLASTGLLLQHSHSWGLDDSFIKNKFILKQYGIGQIIKAFKKDANTLVQVDKNLVINNNIVNFSQKIEKIGFYTSFWIVKTQDSQIWYNQKAKIVQTIDEFDEPAVSNSEIRWLANNKDEQLIESAINKVSDGFLTVEKFIFDIHAGITASSVLNDIAAIGLILLSISGLFLFYKKKTNRSIRH